jgi:hypothetical protein
MHQSSSPLENKSLEHCSFQELLEALASDAMMPGAGTAGGIALALAAACAGKAVAISLRHDVDCSELHALQLQFSDLRNGALALAEADALQFKRYLKSNDPVDTDALLNTDSKLVAESHRLDALLRAHEHRIAQNMTGDWQAARALSRACRLIELGNVREIEGQATVNAECSTG